MPISYKVATEIHFYLKRGSEISGKLYVLPYDHDGQKVYNFNIFSPSFCKIDINSDMFNNKYLKMVCNPSGNFEISIEYNVTIYSLPTSDNNLELFLRSSKYVNVDKFKNIINQSESNKNIETIVKMIKSKIKYSKEVNVKSAFSSLNLGIGKCVNYAHVALGFFRALNIPARYVIGLTPYSNKEAHAWIEVKGSTGWIPVDPTAGLIYVPYIKWAIGRDDADIKNRILHKGDSKIDVDFNIKKL
ncbi:transglutaminase-like domain-containing protein [Saccharolobus caldissimus]|uniref:Transglutaminase n=1 Tax=Saccharolobus caldissimus TaxID=1702097 RepID=A0AAQ4CQG9_9CREN|nr:transglutaminase family protein [Saccharolobus caldissimus]BDB98050.1 transglutaminase [Saccharolobus caldissimus]